MDIALITGAGGLVGSQAVEFFSQKSFDVVGIDNDMRKTFFGQEASTAWNISRSQREYPSFCNYAIDIRDREALFNVFNRYRRDIKVVIHTAAQPSHDWAATDPYTDFEVNANGTLNVLEASRKYCPEAVIIFTSTNKVYGDLPNSLPLVEKDYRWEVDENHPCYKGINENTSIDQSMHSLFGASKVAADILMQEYGRYYGLKVGIFRGSCLTGALHSGTELHGFLSYLMKCAITGSTYKIYGYKGKQVRDNIHSLDLVEAFYQFYKNPCRGGVYNIGGGRENNCSILEAMRLVEEITGKKINYVYSERNRLGDHVWYISDLTKFVTQYPSWRQTYSIKGMLVEIYNHGSLRWTGKTYQTVDLR